MLGNLYRIADLYHIGSRNNKLVGKNIYIQTKGSDSFICVVSVKVGLPKTTWVPNYTKFLASVGENGKNMHCWLSADLIDINQSSIEQYML